MIAIHARNHHIVMLRAYIYRIDKIKAIKNVINNSGNMKLSSIIEGAIIIVQNKFMYRSIFVLVHIGYEKLHMFTLSHLSG